MSQKTEVFYGPEVGDSQLLAPAVQTNSWRDLIEIAVAFGCILVAVWTPPGRVNAFFSIVAAACVIAFAVVGRRGVRELGLARPLAGAKYMLLVGAVLCGVIVVMGILLRSAGAAYTIPLSHSWQYGFWALQQEFILQSIFFVRLEAALGSRRAVIAAAALFSLVHIPSPILTVFSLCGGIFFCELFRRWRNLYPLGIIHGALGLTIAASLPDKWLHHMRVGIGYLMLHS